VAGGGGAASPRPMATSCGNELAKTGGVKIIVLAALSAGTSAAMAKPEKTQGCALAWLSGSFSVCSLPTASTQPLTMPLPVHSLMDSPGTDEGIQPDGTNARTNNVATINIAKAAGCAPKRCRNNFTIRPLSRSRRMSPAAICSVVLDFGLGRRQEYFLSAQKVVTAGR
jgi:hypothetical protein